MENKDLKISQLIPSAVLDGREMLPFAKDDGNGSLLVSLLKDYIINGLAKQSTVDGKQNRLIAGHGIEISPDNTISTTLDVSLFRPVDVLPTADIEENKIYLVKDSDGKEGENEYLEYIHIKGKWEMVGKYTSKIDLSPYMKSADAEILYAKKSEIPDVSPFVPRDEYNLLAERVSVLEKAIKSLETTIKSLPVIPTPDGQIYAMLNGKWESIADAGEMVATVNDFAES